MNKFVLWLILAVIVVVAAAAAFWWFDLRWRPKTITKNQAEIVKLLESAGWVSPGNNGQKLYMIGFRSCSDCIRFKAEEYPGLLKAGVDIRLIEIARGEYNGIMKSTPVERATVAELWSNRSWELAERWDKSPIAAWTAEGIPPADGDIARTAIIEAGRDFVKQITPLLAANGVDNDGFRYPTMVWWTKDGVMRACACEKRETYRFVRAELGAKPRVTP